MLPHDRFVSPNGRRGRGYILLETVVVTGLLVAGLAVIGAKVQDAQSAVWNMRREIETLMLAERHLAELDLGLIELDTVDEVQEGDFGPRFPDYGWVLTIEETAIKQMYLLKLDILHHLREDEYREDEFDYDAAELLRTVYAMRATPQPVNFAEDLGLNDDEMLELSEKISDLGIPGLDPEMFDPAIFGKLDFEELLESLPLLLEALRIDVTQLVSSIPTGLLEQLRNSGMLGDEAEERLMDRIGEGENEERDE